MLKPHVRLARSTDYIFTVTSRRGIPPPWVVNYSVNGKPRQRPFVTWRDAIRFALTEC